MSGTYGGIQTPLKSGLPLCSRGAGPAGVAGRGEPGAGSSWAAVNETAAASVSSIAVAIAEQNRGFTGCLRIRRLGLLGRSRPVDRRPADRKDMIAQQAQTDTHWRGGPLHHAFKI